MIGSGSRARLRHRHQGFVALGDLVRCAYAPGAEGLVALPDLVQRADGLGAEGIVAL